jgi:hypothetical protein
MNLYKYLESPVPHNGTRQLAFLKDSFHDIESQIGELDERIADLMALKQKMLNFIHFVCFDSKLEPLESKITRQVS